MSIKGACIGGCNRTFIAVDSGNLCEECRTRINAKCVAIERAHTSGICWPGEMARRLARYNRVMGV